jgi:hypothetical protein
MILKSGNRFSGKIMLHERACPEKACPGLDPGRKSVFGKIMLRENIRDA